MRQHHCLTAVKRLTLTAPARDGDLLRACYPQRRFPGELVRVAVGLLEKFGERFEERAQRASLPSRACCSKVPLVALADDILAGRDLRGPQLRKAWGDRIAAQRAVAKLSRRDLARRLDVSEQTVGYWERGDTSPRPHMQIAIAHELGVSWAVLFEVAA